MGILDGRGLRFLYKEERERLGPRYSVFADDGATDGLVPLGHAEAATVSTDSAYAGTRIRRPGKGRRAWRAVVPMRDAQALDGFTGGRELVYSIAGTMYIAWSGSDFETRREAGEALAAWYDHPERRTVNG